MKTTTIEELLDKEQTANKAVIPKIQGKITKLFDEKAGENEHGNWSMQNGEIMDATGKITVVFSNNTQPKSARNKTVTITSVEGKRGLAGIMVDDHQYNGKKERRIKVTGSANIEFDAEQEQSKPDPKNGGKSYGTKQSSNPVGNVKQMISDLVAMYKEIYSQMGTLAEGSDFTAATATVFIQATKEGLHYDFQKRYTQVEIPAPPKDPNQWRQCYIPKGEFAGKTLEEYPEDKLLELFNQLSELERNDPFSECVYQAAFDRGVAKKTEPKKEEPEPEDNIQM